MTYRQWEYELKCLLRGIPKEEIKQITDYYSEIWGDKKEAGFSDIDILIEFGTPEECAEKIRAEGFAEIGADKASAAEGDKTAAQGVKKFNIGQTLLRTKERLGLGTPMVSSVAGLIFLTLLVIIPVYAALVSALAAVAAMVIGGVGVSLGGVGAVIWGVVQIFAGNGFAAGLSVIGIGTAMVGGGVILAISFAFITKYSAVGIYKSFKYIYFGKKKNADGAKLDT